MKNEEKRKMNEKKTAGGKDPEAALERLGEISERLGDFIGDALDDRDQFKRYIVTEKGRSDGESVTENVEKVFGKVDFKSVKDAACAIKAIADAVKCVYSVPDEGDGGFSVTFESGAEFAE